MRPLVQKRPLSHQRVNKCTIIGQEYFYTVKFRSKLSNNSAILQKTTNTKLKLRSFNSLHSALSVIGYHDRGQETGKYCPLPEPIRFQNSQNTACSRSNK